MKDILFITNYYPPEKGAASNRIFHMAEGFQQRGFKVSVVCPLPNYPTGKIYPEYRNAFKRSSNEKGLLIYRLWIYASNSKNKFLRLISMLSYSFSLVLFFLFHKIPETVVVQSPPLLVAFTSVFFLKSKKRKILLNVSDLWPSAGLELGAFKKNRSYRLLEKIERYNYNNADMILGQSQEILEVISSINANKQLVLYRNYPDFKTDIVLDYHPPKNKIKLVYAGLLGIAQGVHTLCKHLNYDHIEFHIYGSGSEKEAIESYIESHPDLAILYHGEIERDALHEVIKQYDVTIIPLLNRIYGSVPSKIFEFSKLGLPLLYFGGGEGETIVNDLKLGWSVPPGNYDVLNKVLSEINLSSLNSNFRDQIKSKADRQFDFNTQLDELIPVIRDL